MNKTVVLSGYDGNGSPVNVPISVDSNGSVMANAGVKNRYSRALTVLNEASDLSSNGTPQLWLPTANMDDFVVSASTDSTSGNLEIEYSIDGGATTEAVTTSKALTSGDAVITSDDAVPNGTSPVNEGMFKLFPFFRPKITGASASSVGTIKVAMRGVEA